MRMPGVFRYPDMDERDKANNDICVMHATGVYRYNQTRCPL